MDHNLVWEIMDLPSCRKSIGRMQVHKTKLRHEGLVDQYKETLVAKGFAQREGSDYDRWENNFSK